MQSRWQAKRDCSSTLFPSTTVDRKKLLFSQDATLIYMLQFWIYWVRVVFTQSINSKRLWALIYFLAQFCSSREGHAFFLSLWESYLLALSLDCFFLDGGKVQDAIRASQLCLRLLETSVRDELRRLLAFMATAAHPDASRLQKQVAH